jgi:ABC-type uncharacterized transport system permease subunit
MRNRRRTLCLLLLPLAAWLALFLLVPLAFILVESLRASDGWSLAPYLRVFTKKLYREALLNSLLLSGTTALLGTVIGVPLSYAVFRMGRRGQAIMTTLLALPLTFSGLVIAYAAIVSLGASGFFTLLFKEWFGVNTLEFSAFLFTWKGLVVAYLYFLIPRMILVMMAAWTKADWALLEAAESLGAGRIRTFFKVLLPMFWPSMLAGSSLLFAVSMGAFGTAFALSGTGVNIMPLLIYTQTSDLTVNIAEADALAVTLAVVTTAVVWLYESLTSWTAPAEA